MKYAGGLSGAHVSLGSESVDDGHAFVVPDAGLLFSGDFQRAGRDLIISDPSQRFTVRDYFLGEKRASLVSPEGAVLDPKVVEALTGHVQVAQAGGAPAGKVVGNIVKMTGSASVVRNGVTVVLNVGDAIYQNDVVQTGSGSTLGLVLIDGTAFNLSANARLMMNDLTYDATSTSNASLITLVQGAASFVAGQVAKTGDMRVATPVAVIGIRGTAVILDISSTDGKVSVSVLDQRDGQVHSVQVYDRGGNLIGTVTSSGTGLTLTPTATFEVIAQQSDKTAAQVAQEFTAFQTLLQTYDAGKQMFPDLPQHTDSGKGDPATNPGSPTRYAGSPAPSSPETAVTPPTGTNGSLPVATAPVQVASAQLVPAATSSTSGSSSGSQQPEIIVTAVVVEEDVPVTPLPFAVTPAPVGSITSAGGDHTGPVMSASGDVVYDPDGIVYFYDRETQTTIRVTPDDGWIYSGQTISSDGRYIVYQGTDGSGQSYVFVWGTDPSDAARYHVQTQLVAGGAPAVSGDGSTIAVEQGGSIALYDLAGHLKGTITAAAVGVFGTVWLPAISANGQVIGFWSSDSQSPGGAGHLYTYNVTTGAVTDVATVTSGAGNHGASISADGRYIVYQAPSSNGHSEIYLFDLNAGQVVFSTENAPEIVAGASRNPVISPDGHYIIFTSDARFTAFDHNGFADTYVVDVTNLAAPVFTLISENSNAASDGGVAISAGGLYTAFASNASFSPFQAPGSSQIYFSDPTSGRSAFIRESFTGPDHWIEASGTLNLTGALSGITVAPLDPLGRFYVDPPPAPDASGNITITWHFRELQSEFPSLRPGQVSIQNFEITLNNGVSTTTIPVRVSVYDADQPFVAVVANAGSIVGDDGDNVLTGTLGNDTFQAFGGDDTINGGTGVDRSVYLDATGGITVDLAAGTVTGPGVGTDTLNGVESIQGSNFADQYTAAGFAGASGVPGVPLGFNAFEGMAGDDTITGNVNIQGQALTRISYASATAAVTVNFGTGIASGNASVGTDHFTNVNAVIGSKFADTLIGSDNANGTYEQYDARGGNDLIDGRGGYDFASYNNDPATRSGITVNMAAGTVTGDNSVGTDTLRSVESVRGTNYADVYDARNFGAAGFLNPASNNVGSNGTFNNFDGQGGNDTVFGNGNTRVQYTNSTESVTVDLADTGTGGTGTAKSTVADLAGVGVDTFRGGVNAVMGSMFGDFLYGSAGNDTFQGLAGDDHIDGRGGFDAVQYNNMTYTTGGISVAMAPGLVTGNASTGLDTLRSIEIVYGTNFDDSYDATGFGDGGHADPLLFNVGSSGTFNQFEGLDGDDQITGNGNTRIGYTSASAAVIIEFDLTGIAGSAYSRSTAPGEIADVGVDTFSGVNGAVGSNFADIYDAATFTGGTFGPFNSFQGLGGDDQIIGNGNTQVAYNNASAGVTVDLAAGTGRGTAAGDLANVGNDTFTGVNGVFASNFADTLLGDGNSNFLSGQGGNDFIDGRGGSDVLTGGVGADTFVYGAGYGAAVINDFSRSDGDRIDLTRGTGVYSLNDVLALAQPLNGNLDTFIDFGNGDTLLLANVNVSSLTSADFLFASVPSLLSVSDDAGTLSSGSSTNDTDLTVRVGLSGTNAIAGDTVQIYDGAGTGNQLGASYALTAADITNGFADVQTGTLSDGTTYTLTARITFGTGNQSDASGSFIITEDTTAPSAPMIGALTDDMAPLTGIVADNGFSNDTTPTITGTAEAGSTVTIYDTDGTTVVGSGVATGGNYAIPVALGQGSHTLTAKATDAAGNQGVASTAFHVTIDTAAPTAPIIALVTDDVSPGTGTVANNGSSNDTTLTITGTAEAGSTVTIYDTNGTTVLGSAVAIAGSYSITTSALSEGGHTLTARATDAAGNQGAASAAFNVTIDTANPAPPSITSVFDNVSPVTGPVADNGFSNDTTLTVSGTAEAGSTVRIYDTNGTTVLGTGVATGGNFSITTSALAQGSHTLTARTTDTAGNEGTPSSAFHVTIDTAAPSAPVIGAVTDDVSPGTGPVADNGFSNDTTLTIAGTAEAGSTVTIFDTDGVTALGTGIATGGNYSITTSALSQGSHTLTARATDTAGNQGPASTAFHVTIDTAAPAVPVIGAVTDDVSPGIGTVADNGSSNDITLAVSGTAEAGSTVTIYDTDGVTALGSGLATGGSFSITTSALSAGSHTLTARAIDAAGNEGAASTAFHVTIDTAAPATPLIGAVTDNVSPVMGAIADNGFSNDTTLTITGTAEAGSTVAIYDTDGTTVLGTGVATGGTFSITTSVLDPGAHTLTARATDAAGNEGAASSAFHVTIDTVAPIAPSIISVTDDIAPVTGTLTSGGSTNDTDLTVRVDLSGTNAVAGDTVQLYNGAGTGSQLGASYTLTGADIFDGFADVQTGTLINGTTYTITARVTDAAGNQSTASGSFVVTETGTAPIAPSIVSVTDDTTPVTGPLTSNGSTNDTDLTVRVGLGGINAVAGDTVQLYDGTGTGSPLGTSYTLTGIDITNGFANVQTGALSNGTTYTITARVSDGAGNQSAASNSFVVIEDTTAPTAIASVTALGSDTGTPGDFITNAASQTVSGTYTGTLGSGEKIQVSVDGSTWVDATAGAGTFAAAGVTLTAGTGTLSVRTVDAAGNFVGGSGHGYTLDTTAPTAAVAITSIATDSAPSGTNGDFVTNDTTLSVSGTNGTLGGGEKVQISTDGTTWVDVTPSGATNWSYNDSATHGTGFTYQVRVVDTAGNTGNTASQAVTIDTTAPTAAVAITSIATDSAPSGTNGDFITNDTTLSVSGTNGTLGSGEKVQISTDGAIWVDVTPAGATNWTYNDPASHGTSFTYQVRVVDIAGNIGNTASQAVTIDTAAPTAAVAISSIATDSAPTGTNGDFVTNDTTLTVSGTNGTLGGGEKVQISTDGTTWVDVTPAGATNWTYNDPAVHNVSFTYQVRVVDTAGNVGNTASQAVTIDITTPTAVVAITSITADSAPTGTNSDFVTNDTTLTVAGTNGSLGSGEKVQISTDGTTWADVTPSGATSWTFADPAVHGTSFTYQVRVVDTAGNVGNTANQAITIDTTAPTAAVAITSIATDSAPGGTNGDFVTNDTSLTVSGTNSALGGGEKVQVSTNGTTWVDVTPTGATSWTYSDPAVHSTSFTYQVRVVDTAGNVGNTASQAVTIDTTAPTAAVAITSIATDSAPGGTNSDFVTNDTTLTVSGTNGTLGSGEKVQISTDGATWVDVTPSGATNWTYNDPATHGISFTYQVRVVDIAGNVGNTASQAVTIDTTAPTAAVAITSITTDSGTNGDFITNDTVLSVSGTNGALGSGEKVQISTDGTIWADVTPAGATSWTYNDPATHGTSFTYQVRIVDTAGNVGNTASQAVTIDTTAPTAAVAITSITTDSGSNGDFITNDTVLSVSGTNGTLGGGEKVQISTDGTTWVDVTPAGATSWTYNDPATHGTSFAYQVRVVDTAGNVGNTASQVVTIDTTAPTAAVAITSITTDSGSNGDFITNDTVLSVSGTNGTLGGGEKVQISTNGTIWIDVTPTDATHWTYNDPATHSTSFTYQVRVIDTAGNVGNTTNQAVTIDTTIPAPPSTPDLAAASDSGASNTDNVTSVTTPTFTGTAEVGATVTLFDGAIQIGTATADGSGNWSITSTALGQGAHSITAKATDAAGNISAASSALSVTIDTSAPAAAVAITAVSGSSSPASTAITVSGTNGILAAGDKVQISADGVVWTDVVRTGLTRWSFTDTTARSANFTYSTRVVDAVGNVGATASQAILVASGGATVATSGPSPVTALFTGTGGALQIAAAGGTATINAISVASGGTSSIGGSGNVTTTAGDAIDLYATGAAPASPANLVVNPGGTITGAATGIAVTQNAAGSITITTAGPVTGLAGRGIFAQHTATGTGSILINGSGDVTGTGAGFSGIVAQNLNSSNNDFITISQSGDISGGRNGIRALTNGNGNITITTGPGANITGATLYGIEAIANGSGSISVTTSSVIHSESVGINAYNQATSLLQSANSLISVTANGTIHSGTVPTISGARPAGILAGYRGGTVNTNNPAVSGNVVISNFASIAAAGGDGIRGFNFGSGNVSISSASDVTARDMFGINGSGLGSGNVTILTTEDSIVTSGSHGILAINQANAVAAGANSTVSVTAAGIINSGLHLTPGGASPSGISAGYFGPAGGQSTAINGTVLVDNTATITARGSAGITAFNIGYGHVTVIDRAETVVKGGQFGIAASSSGPANLALPGVASDVTVNVENDAVVTSSSLNGIAAINATNVSGGNITITTGLNDQFRSGGTGINANSAATSVASGKQISVTIAAGTINSGFNSFTNGSTPSGIAAGYSIGPATFNANVHGNVVLDNSATVVAAAGPGINLYNTGNGSISATLRPTSSITSAQAGGVTAFSAGGGNITIDNQGTINASAVGISANNGSTPSANGLISILNSGTINAPGVPFMSVVGIGNGNSTQTATISNGAGHSIASTLFSRTTNNVAISVFGGNGAVTNSGSISGNISFSGNGSITNASGAFWNVNGSNFFGSGTNAISNAGVINMSGIASLSAISAIAFANTGQIFALENSSAQIFGNVTGTGTVNLVDRAALEFGLAVAATQTINLAGKGLLTFDNPASVGSNLPINFTSGSNGNVGSVITLLGTNIMGANVSGSTLTITGSQSYSFQVSGSGLSGNTFNILSPSRIVLVPATGAGTTIASNVTVPTTISSPAAPVNSYSVYVLDNSHITGSGSGFIVATGDTVAANTYAIVVNASSDVSVTGAGAGVRVATSGASAAVINAATLSAGNAGISVDTNLAASGSGSADVVSYGNVTGGQNAIFANTFNGNVSIVAGPGTTLTGTNTFGILGRAQGSGGVNVTTSGGTISGGVTGILALALQASPSGADVVVYNSSNITSGSNSAAANVANSGTGGIRAGILNNNTSTWNPAITGDVTIESRGSITAQYGTGLYAFNYGEGNTSVTLAPGQTIMANAGGTTAVNSGLAQYGIFAFNYGKGSSLVNAGWNTTITSGSSGINAGNQATAIAAGSGSTVAVYSQGFISSGANVNNSGSAPSAIQAGYNPGAAGTFNSAVYGDVIVSVASIGSPTTITAAAGSGIGAYNYAVGNITVSVGSGMSIQALTAATAAGGGNAPYGIGAVNRGPGNIAVTVASSAASPTLINAGSNGINAVNDSNPTAGSNLANLYSANFLAGKPAVVAVTAAGTIQSGSLPTNGGNTPSGIAAGFLGGSSGQSNQYVIGDVFINSTAVVAAAGFGIQGYNYGYGNITINNAPGANITAGSHGIYAHAEGGLTSPLSSGVPTRDIAVNVYGNAAAPTTIVAGQTSGTAYGILALSTNAGSILVTTSTSTQIDSHLGGAGINAVNQAASIAASDNSSVVVTNAAVIHSGSGLTGFGNRPAGITAGYIGGTTNPSPANLTNYDVFGEVVVNNFSNITADSGDGIRAYNYGVGDVTVNTFGGAITALGGASPPAGTGIGILAQSFGPGNVYVTTSASTTITSGGSGIVAVNKASTADPLNPTVIVPATSEILVIASGTIHSGTIPTATASGDPAAGILAGYNANNQSIPTAGIHGDVFVDSHATILAPTGTDGIRAGTYGDGDVRVLVESDSEVMGGRFGVAAVGYNGGDVSVVNNGSVFGGTAALNASTTAAGTATIDNAGFLGGLVAGYNATFTNQASGDWQFSGASNFTGTSTLTNAGTIETGGVSTISGLSSFSNTGLIAVDSGTLTISTAVTGGGQVMLYDASLVFGGASDAHVQFADLNPATGATLVLQDAIHFTGTVSGFTFGDGIDLVGINPASVSITSDGGFLQVSFAGGAFQLLGNYNPGGFSINPDGGSGTFISWSRQTPTIDTTLFTLTDNPDGSTTVTGLQVNDADAAASLTMTAVTQGAASGTTITPPGSSGSLSTVNAALSSVTYDPGSTPPAKDMITLSIVDGWGATDTVTFVFANDGGNGQTLQGTSGKDVIFSTDDADTLIGGAGADQFVFSPSSAQDSVADFVVGVDKIDLRQFAGISSANIDDLIEAAQTGQASGQAGNDTLLTLNDVSNTTILLKNVLAANLHASDFVVHA